MITLLGYLILAACAVAALLLAVHRAPDGWEDDEGFHYGKRPKP